MLPRAQSWVLCCRLQGAGCLQSILCPAPTCSHSIPMGPQPRPGDLALSLLSSRARLEAFSDHSGKLQVPLQEIIDWLGQKDEELSAQLPLRGDVLLVQQEKETHAVCPHVPTWAEGTQPPPTPTFPMSPRSLCRWPTDE